MPNYEFKCEECNLVKEECVSFKESEKGLACECGGKMVRLFIPCKNIHGFNEPYKPGHNAREDRKRAYVSLEERKKLPKSVTAKNSNFADLM